MKNYKEYGKWWIGESDIATLTCVGIDEKGEDIESFFLDFGGDGEYFARIVDEEAEIGEHYKLVHSFTYWCRIYDDRTKAYEVDGKKINIYRAGDFGTIIQVIR
jgi:hypothetical protein